MSTQRTYFVMTPQLVWATCENAHQFTLWSVIKMVAGEDGTCILGTRDLATLAMLSAGTVHYARQDLLRLGLLEGELCRDPGYANAVWHLRIPDLWAANHAWREAHPSLRERIDAKRAQRRERSGLPQDVVPAWPPPAARSPHERAYSAPEYAHSSPESGHSGGESGHSGDETKKNLVLNPQGKRGTVLDTAWKNALVELEMQFSGQVYDAWIRPLLPSGWDHNCAVLLCPNRYAQEWFRERLDVAIQRVLGGILGRSDLRIEYRLPDDGRQTLRRRTEAVRAQGKLDDGR